MSGTFATLETAIGRGLRARARVVAHEGNGRWRVAPGRGRRIPIEGTLQGSWFVLQAALEEYSLCRGHEEERDPNWELLKVADELPPLIRIAIDARHGELCVRAESPIDREINPERRAKELCAGIEQALALPGRRPRRVRRRGDEGAEEGRLAGLLSEAGRSFRSDGERSVSVDLEGSRGMHRAALIDQGRGGIRITAPLGSVPAPGPASRQALGMLLLSVAGGVRLARAAVDRDEEGSVTPRFEIRLPAAPVAAEIEHALAALSVACDLCAAEAQAIVDENLAEQYLLARGAAPIRQQTVGTARAS